MAITFKAVDPELEALALKLKQACVEVPNDIALTLRFSTQQDALSKKGALAASPAFLRKSTATIIVVREEWMEVPPTEQFAIALHEVGHARQPDSMTMSEAEFDADLFVCERGFVEPLAENRRRWYSRKVQSLGERYASALLKWQTRDDALSELRGWYQVYLALG